MASETDICNMGLFLIGDEKIENLTDDNDRARVANLFYDDTRDAMLRMHPFGFSKVWAELARAAGSPKKWAYHFTLPVAPKCLRVLKPEESYPGQIPYSVEGRKLLCNASAITILYIAQITDTGVFDALFTDLLAARLAAVFAQALTKQKTLIELAWKVYDMKKQEAQTVDGLESTKEEMYNDTLISVR